MKVLVIIPVYNEEGSIERVANELKAAEPEFDYIVVMDSENYRDCKTVAARDAHSKIYFLSEFVDGETFRCGKDVPDPWYTGDFELTYELVELGCEGLLNKIRTVVAKTSTQKI